MRPIDVEHLVLRGASSLADSLLEYWPAEANNEICERNVCLHLARSFSNDGFFVYGECNSKQKTDKRLDLLAIHPREATQILVEAKRLYSVEKLREIQKDIDRLLAFKLIDDELDGKLEHKFCIVAATTWNDEYAQWWSTKDGENPTKDSAWDDISNHPALKDAIWGSRVLHGYRSYESRTANFQYLLYCIFEKV